MYRLRDYPYDEWMKNLPESLHDIPLNNLAIPGSHDSFSFAITSSSKIAPDANDTFKSLVKYLGRLGRWAIAKWARTQELTFEEQLNSGIRYMDLRAAANSSDKGRHYFVHALYSMPVEDGLTQIATFLNSHPKEIVLLDFNHFYAMNGDSHWQLCRLIKRIFKDKLVPFQSSPPSLNQLWIAKQQVIVFYHNDDARTQEFPLWPGYYIPSPWANTAHTDILIEYLNERYQNSRRPNWFLICQGILTPDTGMILKNVFAGIKGAAANKATPAFVKWLEDKRAGPNGINGCIVDYVEDFDYISTVLGLNLRAASVIEEANEKGDVI